MRIQDLENRTGLERPTIRFYEREGLLKPKRSENGYREYSDSDAEQLLKIKLLRQLGMPVYKIKDLQRGCADFSAELETQIRLLTEQIQQNKHAREVCKVIQNDGVNYQTMDPERYLKLLRELPADRPAIRNGFHENVEKEIHPWRRFAARTLDYTLFSAIIRFLLFVIFRIRPISGFFLTLLLNIGYGLLFVPVEALMLHLWGTTLGKWIMGIRLDYIQGGNLPLGAAFRRAFRVYKSGMGFCLPVIQPLRNLIYYCTLTGRALFWWRRYEEIDPPDDLQWDEETEIIYSVRTGKENAGLAGFLALWVLISTITVMDIAKPKYRGNALTVAQFAENYNYVLDLLDEDHERYQELQPDGTKYPYSDTMAVISIGGTQENQQDNFAYETEGGFIRTISYQNSWQDIFYVQPVGSECYNAAVSLLMAQDGYSLPELYEFSQLWETEQNNAISSFRYQILEVSWEIQYKDCQFYNGILMPESEANGTAEVIFKLTIDKS